MLVSLWGVAHALDPAMPLAATTRTLGGDLEVSCLNGYPSPTDTTPPRTYPLGLVLTSRGAARTVELSLPDGERAVVELAAGQSVRWFADQTVNYNGSSVKIVDGRTRESTSFSVPELTYVGREKLTLATLGRAWAGTVDPWVEDLGSLDQHLPDTWTRLAGFDLIVLTADPAWTAAGARPAEWAVLRDWVLAGGVLVALLPAGEAVPEPVRALLRSASAPLGTPDTWIVGVGVVHVARPPPGMLTIEALLPPTVLGPSGAPRAAGNQLVWPNPPTPESLHAAVRRATVPPYGMIGVMLAVYAMLVGPAGWLYWVRRRQQPGMYLLFTFAVSAASSLAIVGVDLGSTGSRARGLGGHLRVIDQVAGVEIDAGHAVVFAPTFDGADLEPGLHAVADWMGWGRFEPMFVGDNSCMTARDGRCDERVICQFGTDAADCGSAHWLGEAREGAPTTTVRTVQAVTGVAVRPSTGAVLVTPGPNGPTVENHLGLPLQDLVLWHGGRVWRVPSLAAGAQQRASPTDTPSLPPMEQLPGRLAAAFTAHAHGSRDRYVARGSPRAGFPRLLANGFRPVEAPEGPEDLWLVVGLL